MRKFNSSSAHVGLLRILSLFFIYLVVKRVLFAMEDNGLTYEPKDRVLNFTLGVGRSTASIKLKNVNSDRVLMYKVKLTMPMLYYVEPNLSILEPGQELETVVSMVDEYKEKFTQATAMGEEISTHKHRLMVQAVTLSAESGKEAIAIKRGDKNERDYYKDVWTSVLNGDDSNKSSTYFSISYNFEGGHLPNKSATTADANTSFTSPVLEYKSTRRSAPKSVPATPEEVRGELIKLRKEYETLLQTFCRVQAEKESLEQEKEVKIGELRDFKDMKVSGTFGEAIKNDRAGFSLIFFVVSICLAFVLGQYLSK